MYQFKNPIKHLHHFVYFFLVAVFFSCETNETVVDPNNLLVGNWANPVYNGDSTTFKRSSSLPNENAGIAFKLNGGFIERTSGWCGTPPLSFFNVEGNYQLEEEIIKIAVPSYISNYNLRIISLNETELIVKRELTEQEIDHGKLMNLYHEIEDLSFSVSCTNSDDWMFTEFGSKACGGPQGFIPYSNKIDTVNFLQKVATYTQSEKDFNLKWDITSDCSIPNKPTSLECISGYPILYY